jgi:GTPase SAR1 family protein
MSASTDPTLNGPPSTSTLSLSTSLEEFQSHEQRRVLDIVAQIRKYGLNGYLSLPQIIVCGDQSAGKSSVLKALTKIPFPRSDNLCTRFAIEITLQRASVDSLQVCIIPDQARPASEKDAISTFSETINDFSELPSVIDAAKEAMGIGSSTTAPRSFAKDVLSIRIEGPRRPQLTLVDVPGLIQTETKGSTKEDREMVARITEDYIQQPRTICLAVISATNDYAN